MEHFDNIADWMTKDLVFVDISATLEYTISKMRQQKIGAILIFNNNELAGIFTERDLLAIVEKLYDIATLKRPISDFMSKNPITAQTCEKFPSVYMKMKVNTIRHLPVKKGKEIVGIVSIRDLTKFYENKLEGDLEETRAKFKQLQSFFNLAENNETQKIVKELGRLEALSLTDFQTGLYNSRYFKSRLNEELARAERHDTKLSLIFCDIDFFKKINDTYGHQYGDTVLKDIGQILISKIDDFKIIARLRTSDVVARYGGEEFVIILPETEKESAVEVGERIRRGIAEHSFTCENSRVKLTMSFGIAEYPTDAKNYEELIKCADIAMYKAKHLGRNLVEVYTPE